MGGSSATARLVCPDPPSSLTLDLTSALEAETFETAFYFLPCIRLERCELMEFITFLDVSEL